VQGAQPTAGNDVMSVLSGADREAARMKDQYATGEHLLLACAGERCAAAKALAACGVQRAHLERAMADIRKASGVTNVTDQEAEGSFEALKKYAIDLTERAQSGKLDPVIGRDEEVRRCMQVLSRRTKNNPVLIGEPGVGKTAIVEGSRSASSAATAPNPCAVPASWRSTSVRCSRAPSTAASSRSA
jgi:ATP-dependent Clp protease ATP-binding subunit ClpB